MIQYITWNEDGSLVIVGDSGHIIFSQEDTNMVDQYGNTFSINSLRAMFEEKAPTYSELYDHWQETKGDKQ